MQKRIYAVLTTLIGALLLLPILGVNNLGNINEGLIGWMVPLAIIAIGISGFIRK